MSCNVNGARFLLLLVIVVVVVIVIVIVIVIAIVIVVIAIVLMSYNRQCNVLSVSYNCQPYVTLALLRKWPKTGHNQANRGGNREVFLCSHLTVWRPTQF